MTARVPFFALSARFADVADALKCNNETLMRFNFVWAPARGPAGLPGGRYGRAAVLGERGRRVGLRRRWDARPRGNPPPRGVDSEVHTHWSRRARAGCVCVCVCVCVSALRVLLTHNRVGAGTHGGSQGPRTIEKFPSNPTSPHVTSPTSGASTLNPGRWHQMQFFMSRRQWCCSSLAAAPPT